MLRYPFFPTWNASTHAPPEDAVCIHVRHGDKFQEMTYVRVGQYWLSHPPFPWANTARNGDVGYYSNRLHPMTEYLEAAALLIEHDESLSSNRNIFLSTDDADIIDDIARGAFDHMNFTIYYTRYDLFATEV